MISQKIIGLSCILLFSVTIGFSQFGSPFENAVVDGEEIFKVVEEMPRFPGCEESEDDSMPIEICAKQKMLEYIYDKLVYPEEAKEKVVEGMSVIQFIVWKDGSIRDVLIVRDPGSGTGEAARQVIESMKELEPGWRAGYKEGKAVCVQYTLPIKFELGTKYDLKDLEQQPKWPDCENADDPDCTTKKLQEFIKERMVYPESALQMQAEGTVKVNFIIELDGSLSNIKGRSRVSGAMNKDAEAIFQAMNTEGMRWIPGKIGGEAVRTKYTVEVVYSLEERNGRN